jgi:3alpha(or 20beta)-hydroxysteroid dehydrogenase
VGRVEGKVVTGAARGQGAAEDEAFARKGASVVAADVADEPTGPFSSEDVTGAVHYHQLDVSRQGDWSDLAGWVEREHERVDGLVNNAGIAHRACLGEVERADWERVFSVNVMDALLGIQTLLPLMARGGSIVNVGSLATLTGHYTASKWALRGVSRAASIELGPRGIRVNTIHPGYIETLMTAWAPEAFLEANNVATPLGRGGRSTS